jgi:hypothetical protein
VSGKEEGGEGTTVSQGLRGELSQPASHTHAAALLFAAAAALALAAAATLSFAALLLDDARASRWCSVSFWLSMRLPSERCAAPATPWSATEAVATAATAAREMRVAFIVK